MLPCSLLLGRTFHIWSKGSRPDVSSLVNWRIAWHRWARKRKKVQIEWRHGKKHGGNGGGGTLLCHVVGKISGRRVPVTMILPFPASLARPRYSPPPFPTPDVPPVFKRFSHSSLLSSSLSAFSQPSLFRYPLLSLYLRSISGRSPFRNVSRDTCTMKTETRIA